MAAASPGVTVFTDPETLPPDCAPLLESADFFASRPWWQTMLEAGLPPAASPRFLLWRRHGTPAALLPMLALDGGRSLQSLTNPYSCLFHPLLRPGLDEAALHQAGQAFGRYCRAWPVVRLDALDADAPSLAPLRAGFRAAGLIPAPFDHFGNWHEPVAGVAWPGYLQSRRGELRETIRRKLRRAERDGIAHSIVTTPEDLPAGIAAYEAIYARSWKTPEPYPDFNPQMMRHAAAAGTLRLGLLHAGPQPIAAQIWIVAHTQATVLKLAHDEAFKTLSPGTLLTALMIRSLLDETPLTELDFGRGDDPYKQLWTRHRRQRIGLLLLNPRRPEGLRGLVLQWIGKARRGLRPSTPLSLLRAFARRAEPLEPDRFKN